MFPAEYGVISVEEQPTVSARRRLQNRAAQRRYRGMSPQEFAESAGERGKKVNVQVSQNEEPEMKKQQKKRQPTSQ